MYEYTSKGGVARAHSDNGNLLDDGELTFVWEAPKNHPLGTRSPGADAPGGLEPGRPSG